MGSINWLLSDWRSLIRKIRRILVTKFSGSKIISWLRKLAKSFRLLRKICRKEIRTIRIRDSM